MKTYNKDYKTINFLIELGLDIKGLKREEVKNFIFNTMLEYDIKGYHHDILKRPYNLYDLKGCRVRMYNNYLNELESIRENNLEIIKDREYKQYKKQQALIYLLIVFIVLVLIILFLTYDLYLNILYR